MQEAALDPESAMASNLLWRECAKVAFVKGLKAMLPTRWKELLPQTEKVPCRKILLGARVRIEVMSLLLRRIEWQNERSAALPIVRYLGADASPQLGLEIFSGGYDEVVGCLKFAQVFNKLKGSLVCDDPHGRAMNNLRVVR